MDVINDNINIKLNCRGEIITLPRDVAERFFPMIKSAKNISNSGEYFINHKASDVHSLLDSLEIPLRQELGIFEDHRKIYTVDDILIFDSYEIIINNRVDDKKTVRDVVIDNKYEYLFLMTSYFAKVGNSYLTEVSLFRNKVTTYPSPLNKLYKKILYTVEGKDHGAVNAPKEKIAKAIVKILNEP